MARTISLFINYTCFIQLVEWVVSPSVKRMASDDTLHSEQRPPQETILTDGLIGIFRAGWPKPTSWRQKWRTKQSVKINAAERASLEEFQWSTSSVPKDDVLLKRLLWISDGSPRILDGWWHQLHKLMIPSEVEWPLWGDDVTGFFEQPCQFSVQPRSQTY